MYLISPDHNYKPNLNRNPSPAPKSSLKNSTDPHNWIFVMYILSAVIYCLDLIIVKKFQLLTYSLSLAYLSILELK